MSKYNLACAAFEEVIKEKDCFTLKQLDINGHDLIKAGITDGKQIGNILDKLLGMVIDEKSKIKTQSLCRKQKN